MANKKIIGAISFIIIILTTFGISWKFFKTPAVSFYDNGLPEEGMPITAITIRTSNISSS